MTPSSFAALFAEFRAASWAPWRGILAKVTPAVRELYVIAGRGSGKSRMVSLLACCYGARRYCRAPGERIYVGVFGPDRKQAKLTFSYIVGLLRSVPELEALIERESRESLDLRNGVTVEVISATKAAPRGRSYALAIVEEAAFLPQDDSANPDVELVRAVRPALARVPGSLLAVVSSPYARRGLLWEAWKRHGSATDEIVVGGAPTDVLVIRAPTLQLNPTFDASAITRAREEDPASASAEYDAEFRADVESFVSQDAVEACVVPGRHELPPSGSHRAFVDPAGGSGAGSMTLAIGHREGDQVVIDATREMKPPFSPEQVTSDFAALLSRYQLASVTGDRFGGEWPREQFRKRGIRYDLASRPKSSLYRDALPLVNSRQIELPDDRRLTTQIVGLERRTGRGGRDSIDHAPGGHDDLANSVLGLAAELAVTGERKPRFEVLW